MADLQQYDRKRVMLEVTVQGDKRFLTGFATFGNDPSLGECLRIRLDDCDLVELLLSAETWSGQIVPYSHGGCEYLVRLDDVNCPW